MQSQVPDIEGRSVQRPSGLLQDVLVFQGNPVQAGLSLRTVLRRLYWILQFLRGSKVINAIKTICSKVQIVVMIFNIEILNGGSGTVVEHAAHIS